MSAILSILFCLLPLQATSPEEMYSEYITPETSAVLEQFQKMEQDIQEAEKASRARKTLILLISIAVGIIPLVSIGIKAVRGKTWQDNPGGTARALGVALAGGAVLFAFNYGILMLKLKMGDAFNTALAFILVAALIVGSVYLLRSGPKAK